MTAFSHGQPGRCSQGPHRIGWFTYIPMSSQQPNTLLASIWGKSISYQTAFYIPSIQAFAVALTHLCIILLLRDPHRYSVEHNNRP